MKKLLLFVGMVAITAMSCSSNQNAETAANADSVAVVGNVDSTCAAIVDSCAVDTCKK